ncbi:hypothetical protein [Asticcacaulis sp. 201]|uniref:hypothetical protein n=1 Tax=Asticcacaulis sp. 201 TaxID=3028787 RepID=UPI00291619A8|nr:hypothetical protein [Asticcacaulis sp. 201]MDV6329228.1 hypothetical protein [Asticcacaulis sp. 201]
MKLRTWGRKSDPRKLEADRRRQQLMIYTAIYGGSSAGVLMMALAASALSR